MINHLHCAAKCSSAQVLVATSIVHKIYVVPSNMRLNNHMFCCRGSGFQHLEPHTFTVIRCAVEALAFPHLNDQMFKSIHRVEKATPSSTCTTLHVGVRRNARGCAQSQLRSSGSFLSWAFEYPTAEVLGTIANVECCVIWAAGQ